MNFDVTEIQEEITQLTRKFVREKLQPLVEEDEKNAVFRPEIIQGLGELGLTGIPTEEQYGGMGLGYLEYISSIQEIASVSTTYAISVAVTGLPQLILQQFGSDAQKKKHIPQLASGKAIGGFALSEPSSGSDAGSLRTTAKKEGKHYLVNGTKLWITQANLSEIIILMARTGGDGPRGISSFILEKGMPGFKLGKKEEKMGMNSSPTYEISLENVKIPAENLIGNEGDGFKIAMTALNSGRITIGATACGVARESLQVALQHSKEREQFGKAIHEFQGVSFMLADMKTQLDAAWLMVQRAAWMKDQGLNFEKEAAMAKLFATDMAMKATTDGVQILGGSGYTREFPVERLMREAKVLQIVEGTNQIQRLLIAKRLIK